MPNVCGRLTSEALAKLLSESGAFIGTECAFDVCGQLITENGFGILTEGGDRFVTECFVPIPAVTLHPGKVWKKRYPYWQSRPKPRDKEEEELIIMAAMMDD